MTAGVSRHRGAFALPELARMGYRNLSRNPRRTWITALALGGGLALSNLSWVYMEGFIGDTVDALVGGTTGHLQIQPPGQLDEPNLYDTLPDTEGVLARLEADPRVAGAAPRIYAAGLLSKGDLSAGASLLGLDPAREGGVTRLPEQVAEGRFLSGPGEVVLGTGLARRLQAEPGSEVVVLSQAADGSMANTIWEVTGLIETGSEGVDRSTAWIDRAEAEELFALDGAHQVTVRLREDVDALSLVRDLTALPGWTGVRSELELIGGAAADAAAEGAADAADMERWSQPNRIPVDPEASYVVRTWRAINPVIADTIEVSTTWLLLLVGIVLGTAGMGAMNTMLMSVTERTRELGILMAVGMKPRQVVALVLAESVGLAGLAAAVGTPLGLALSWYLVEVGLDFSGSFGEISFSGVTMEPIFRGRWSAAAFAWPIAVLVVVSVAASLWPAIRAARLDPVQAMGRRA